MATATDDASQRVEAVIFDMDGVTVNSVSHKRDHWEAVIGDEFGLEGVDVEALIGLNVFDKYRYLVENHGLDAGRDEFRRALDRDVDRVYEERAELLTGMEATLEWLSERSVPTGLASASSRPKVELVVDRFELDRWLDAVVSADDISAASKPDPAIYRHTASLLSVDPAACVAVEDSAHGATAATRAGMYCLGYNPPASPERDLDRADEVVTTPADLHARVEALVDPAGQR